MEISNSGGAAENIIQKVSRIISYGSSLFLILMMMLTVADVFFRYAFRKPILGSVELTEYMMVPIVFLGLAWCTLRGEHAKVDLVVGRFSPRVQAIFDSVTCLLCLVVSSLMSWQALLELNHVWSTHKASHMLSVPAHPFYFLMAFGLIMLSLSILTVMVQRIIQGVKP